MENIIQRVPTFNRYWTTANEAIDDFNNLIEDGYILTVKDYDLLSTMDCQGPRIIEDKETIFIYIFNLLVKKNIPQPNDTMVCKAAMRISHSLFIQMYNLGLEVSSHTLYVAFCCECRETYKYLFDSGIRHNEPDMIKNIELRIAKKIYKGTGLFWIRTLSLEHALFRVNLNKLWEHLFDLGNSSSQNIFIKNYGSIIDSGYGVPEIKTEEAIEFFLKHRFEYMFYGNFDEGVAEFEIADLKRWFPSSSFRRTQEGSYMQSETVLSRSVIDEISEKLISVLDLGPLAEEKLIEAMNEYEEET